MKKKTIWAFAGLIGFLSCQPSDTVPPPEEANTIPLHFVLRLNEEVLPFSTKGMPPFDLPEPVPLKSTPEPEADEKEVGDVCRVIEYIVYDNGQPADTLRHRRFLRGEDDYGIVYDSLPEGRYTIAFLAHSSTHTEVTDQVMQFDEVTDTFWKKTNLQVARGAEISQSVILERIVSRIEFTTKETVPENLKNFHLTSAPQYNRVDVLTGTGLAAGTPYVLSHLFTEEEQGAANLSFGFLSFVPGTGDPLLSITLVAEDTAGADRYRQTVPSVKPLANRLVRYTGYLFTPPASGDTFHLSIGNVWGEPDEHTLNN